MRGTEAIEIGSLGSKERQAVGEGEENTTRAGRQGAATEQGVIFCEDVDGREEKEVNRMQPCNHIQNPWSASETTAKPLCEELDGAVPVQAPATSEEECGGVEVEFETFNLHTWRHAAFATKDYGGELMARWHSFLGTKKS